ncbi:aminotransferase class I/II-fold pyridoxal phosphate-dependent enzyme [Paludibacter sp. 221]|uniref:aminotransferase class I/II-fold pyridoxal phosphate-dependent enzyme n=1 Tax=Paludibacter sp. 221 TaxID=2302939 RepID=UPI0013D2E0D1|nr:aminotransferase class I/II-fold pyridoxal phosphate-dependent enzyme [Paludibacter sp. 221]NDV46909.1 aminotransferase class I/II-fold pyridoxal phosphate-dependent enzyme [Paludibacter sp. 221]
MVDIFDRLKKAEGDLGQYRSKSDGYFMFPILEGEIGPHMKFNGKEVLNWSLNNYLGLANHPEVRKADAEGAAQFGMAAPMGARMMSGQTKWHMELEQKLAKFVGRESGYLVNFGYQAMVSIIDSLLTRKDVVVYDSESHACILDGLRLHIGKRFVYQHNDMDSLRKQLVHATKLAEEQGGGILVITEGVFGMAGDLGALDKIVALKKEFKFRLLIDDAHGFGTMGPTGAGTDEHFGVQKDVDIYFATFAKSMAGIGAFVASDTQIVDYLRYNMRSQIFAKSLPMPMVIGALKRLELLQTKPELRENLWSIANALQDGLRKEGFDLGNTESPVTPVYLNGSVPEGTNVVIDLRENHGIFCSIVVYPVVPKGVLMLRVIPTAVHTMDDVNRTIEVFKKVKAKLDAGEYKSDEMQNMKLT